MSDIIQTLATHTGLDSSSIEKAIAAILGMLKLKLPAETYTQVEEKIPPSAQATQPPDESSGGLLDTAKDLAGKIFGSKTQEGLDLVDQLSKLGISAATLTTIATQLFKFLSAHLPPDVMAQLAKALPSIPGLNLTSEDLTEKSPTP